MALITPVVGRVWSPPGHVSKPQPAATQLRRILSGSCEYLLFAVWCGPEESISRETQLKIFRRILFVIITQDNVYHI